MITLGLNTVESLTSISLLNDDTYMGSININEKRKTAAMLIPYIDYLLSQFGLLIGDVGLISICSGPGSYTSLRIGYSTAKTLCIVNDIKFMEVSRFRLMSETFLEYSLKLIKDYHSLNIVAVLPTTYDKVLTQSFTYDIETDTCGKSVSRLKEMTEPEIAETDSIIDKSKDPRNKVVIGQIEGHRKKDSFSSITNLANYYEYKNFGTASVIVAQLGAEALRTGQEVSDTFTAEPLYLQSPF